MKAICVTPERALEVREIPVPEVAAPGHVLVEMEGSAINHGDKTFLRMPRAAGNALAATRHDVWGASGAGVVSAVGEGVPAALLGRQVALYRSLARSPETVGLWCERAHVPFTNCLILPEDVRASDYCGSLVNVMTAHAFLEEIAEAGHAGVIATAGNSATGRALGALARRRGVPAILLARDAASAEALRRAGEPHVVQAGPDGAPALAELAASLGATAVFDGVGGATLSALLPHLPSRSTVYAYGFLDHAAPLTLSTALLMMKELTIRRFSNFDSATVRDPARLVRALAALEGVIGDPALRTRIGRRFRFDEIGQAMDYAGEDGAKAVLVAHH